MSDKTFESYEDFSEWVRRGDGDKITVPMPGADGWVLELGDQVAMRSNFYDVAQSKPYGAPKILGHGMDYAGDLCTGVIHFGFGTEGLPKVINRRRLVSRDTLLPHEELLAVINNQPDRVEEPVAIVITSEDRDKWATLSADRWLSLLDSVKDGLETLAVRELRRQTARLAEEKLSVSPEVSDVQRTLGNRAFYFRVPRPADHLMVVELGKLPIASEFPKAVRVFTWAPQVVGKDYANHAHTEGQELFVCTSGRVEFDLSDGHDQVTITLDRDSALFIKPGVWHTVRTLEEGSSLLVMADVPYDREAHYEEDFESFCAKARCDS